MGNQESSDLVAVVRDERRPAAWTGRMSPNVDMAAADLSLNLPTCPSVHMDPSFSVLSPNLLPTYTIIIGGRGNLFPVNWRLKSIKMSNTLAFHTFYQLLL